jgi:hypothetical protein
MNTVRTKAKEDILEALGKVEVMTVKEISVTCCLSYADVNSCMSQLCNEQKVSKIRLSSRTAVLWALYHPALSQVPVPQEIVEHLTKSRGLKMNSQSKLLIAVEALLRIAKPEATDPHESDIAQEAIDAINNEEISKTGLFAHVQRQLDESNERRQNERCRYQKNLANEAQRKLNEENERLHEEWLLKGSTTTRQSIEDAKNKLVRDMAFGKAMQDAHIELNGPSIQRAGRLMRSGELVPFAKQPSHVVLDIDAPLLLSKLERIEVLERKGSLQEVAMKNGEYVRFRDVLALFDVKP